MREIALARGRGVALVDDDDYARVSLHRWYWMGGYAMAGIKQPGGRKQTRMHRFILHLAGAEFADHRNGDGLDNRRANLRICTPSQNAANARRQCIAVVSPYMGVVDQRRYQPYRAGGRPWRACIKHAGVRRTIGYYPTAEEAAAAYDDAARAQWAEFATVNFPRDGERGALRAA